MEPRRETWLSIQSKFHRKFLPLVGEDNLRFEALAPVTVKGHSAGVPNRDTSPLSWLEPSKLPFRPVTIFLANNVKLLLQNAISFQGKREIVNRKVSLYGQPECGSSANRISYKMATIALKDA